ncbi:MAG: membrane protein insertion efficiency factor YidD [Phycisphaerales bacterium]|nr:membrane protein insertion efficiency factor YidD [Phycisphaerales bacterium]
MIDSPSLAARLCITLIRLYQRWLSPILGGACRFHPSCSVYGIEAFTRVGFRRGVGLTLRRLARCHPWGGSGADPVP